MATGRGMENCNAEAYANSANRHSEFFDAKTFRTSDKDKPNCRAIRVGLIPALKAARTALVWPRVNLGEAISGFGPRAGLPNDKGSFDTCAADPLLDSGRKSESNLPRRFASPVTAARSRSRSTSFRYPTALFKFKGRAGRFGWRAAAGAPAFSAGGSSAAAAEENRFGVFCSAVSRSMIEIMLQPIQRGNYRDAVIPWVGRHDTLWQSDKHAGAADLGDAASARCSPPMSESGDRRHASGPAGIDPPDPTETLAARPYCIATVTRAPTPGKVLAGPQDNTTGAIL